MALDYLWHIRNETRRFAQVLDGVEPTEEVPTCPGWNAADLLWHLGEVQYFWAHIVRGRLTDPDTLGEPDRPEGYGALADFLRSSDDALLDALETTPIDTPVWTFVDEEKTTRFTRRRQAHEALIHRVDAELTAGIEPEVDAELATDGVFEVLEWMYSGVPPWAEYENDGAIGLVNVTDTGAGRLVRLGRWNGTSPRSGKVYADEPRITVIDAGEPTFEVSGAARDLDLWLWNRPIPGDVTLSGDTTEFERIIAEGVQ